MAEELLEINETDEVTKVGVTNAPEETAEPMNPFFAYLQSAFNKERADAYFSSLNEEQQKFLASFVAGFQSAIGHTIVGVYDYNYIDGFHFTPEILQTVNVFLRPVEVTDLEMKFVVVAQY